MNSGTDDAVERRDHALIGLLLGKNPDQALLCRDVRLGDADRGLLGFEAEAIGVAELRGRPALLDQGADAVIGHAARKNATLRATCGSISACKTLSFSPYSEGAIGRRTSRKS